MAADYAYSTLACQRVTTHRQPLVSRCIESAGEKHVGAKALMELRRVWSPHHLFLRGRGRKPRIALRRSRRWGRGVAERPRGDPASPRLRRAGAAPRLQLALVSEGWPAASGHGQGQGMRLPVRGAPGPPGTQGSTTSFWAARDTVRSMRSHSTENVLDGYFARVRSSCHEEHRAQTRRWGS